MMMFVIGFFVAWFLLGFFFYERDSEGSWCILEHGWDTILMMCPAIPFILLIEIIEEKILRK